MINKSTCAVICLALSLFVSCRNNGEGSNDGKIDSLIARTRGEVWGFMTAEPYPAENEVSVLTKRIYPLSSTLQQGPVSSAEGDGQQIYLTETLNATQINELANNEKKQTATVSNLLGALKQRSASGIVLDFGDIGFANVQGYLKFVKRLSDTLHNQKLAVAVVTPPLNSFHETELTVLTQTIDYILFDFSSNYRIENASVNPYSNSQMSIITTMSRVLMSPIDLHKVLLLLPTDDKRFGSSSDFALHAGLAGVAVKYNGTKADKSLTDSLKAKFQYTDTIRVAQ